MSITIRATRDVEDIIRQALGTYMTAYCRPYPAEPQLPNVLIQQAGGTDADLDIDTTTVVIDARAETEGDAINTLRVAIGAIKTIAAEQTTPLRHVEVNTSGRWGKDPNDQTVAMCSATLQVTTHKERITIAPKTKTKQGGHKS